MQFAVVIMELHWFSLIWLDLDGFWWILMDLKMVKHPTGKTGKTSKMAKIAVESILGIQRVKRAKRVKCLKLRLIVSWASNGYDFHRIASDVL